MILPLLLSAQQGDPEIEIVQGEMERKAYKNLKRELKSADKHYSEKMFYAYQAALKKYLKILDHYPDNAALNYKTGICYLETNNKQAALSYLQKAGKSNPDITPYLNRNLGRAYHQHYRFDEAIEHYEKYKKWQRYNDGNVKKTNRKIRQCERGKKCFLFLPVKNMPWKSTKKDMCSILITLTCPKLQAFSRKSLTLIFTK
ncbi:MAG: tetratricopeptide repeat protein [Bacteroidales bacterium]